MKFFRFIVNLFNRAMGCSSGNESMQVVAGITLAMASVATISYCIGWVALACGFPPSWMKMNPEYANDRLLMGMLVLMFTMLIFAAFAAAKKFIGVCKETWKES